MDISLLLCISKYFLMDVQNEPGSHLREIKDLMNKSSRFISLSGWSGVSAGLCALIAAVYTGSKLKCWASADCVSESLTSYPKYQDGVDGRLLITIGLVTLTAAVLLAFLFTWRRSQQTGMPIWGFTAKKVMWNVSIPLLVGAVVILRMMQLGFYGFVAPACLIFYGLGLINASKYTLQEIRYLGYFQVALGLVNLWMIGYGLYFWAAGFGLLHIIYGIIMWNKYERNN
jgi:hypothetical protein